MRTFAQGNTSGPAEDGLERWLYARSYLDRDAALEADIAYLTRTLPVAEARLAHLSRKDKRAA